MNNIDANVDGTLVQTYKIDNGKLVPLKKLVPLEKDEEPTKFLLVDLVKTETSGLTYKLWCHEVGSKDKVSPEKFRKAAIGSQKLVEEAIINDSKQANLINGKVKNIWSNVTEHTYDLTDDGAYTIRTSRSTSIAAKDRKANEYLAKISNALLTVSISGVLSMLIGMALGTAVFSLPTLIVFSAVFVLGVLITEFEHKFLEKRRV